MFKYVNFLLGIKHQLFFIVTTENDNQDVRKLTNLRSSLIFVNSFAGQKICTFLNALKKKEYLLNRF